MNVPCKGDLQDDEDEDHEQDGEKVRLVVEGVDGLLRCANLEEPIELTCSHCVESLSVLIRLEVADVYKKQQKRAV